MIMDFGGKEHIWVRLKDKKAYEQVKAAAEVCRDNSLTFSSAVLSVLACITPEYLTGQKGSVRAICAALTPQ